MPDVEKDERLRDEVIAVIAEHFWDGNSDNGQPDYDTIADLFDEAVRNVETS